MLSPIKLFRAAKLRQRGREQAKAAKISIDDLLQDQTPRKNGEFDIFLSHSSQDKELVLGMRSQLQESNLHVYVDSIEDPDLNTPARAAELAARLKERMRQCRGMLYIVTSSARTSRWMPWELGYFDGLKGRVGILPVEEDGNPYTPDVFDSFYPPIYLAPPVLGASDEPVEDRLRVDLPGGSTTLRSWLGP